MRILILTDYLHPNKSAASSIGYSLASYLTTHQEITIDIFGISKQGWWPKAGNAHLKGVKAYNVKTISFLNCIHKKGVGTVKRRMLYALHPSVFRVLLANRGLIAPKYGTVLEDEYLLYAKRLINTKTYDCVLAICQPIYIARILRRIELRVPVIIYKVDPWHTNYYLDYENELKEERLFDRMASAILMHPTVFVDYAADGYTEFVHKTFTVEYPSVYRRADGVRQKKKDGSIICAFVGNLYSAIRSPEYTIRLFAELADANIELHFVGGGTGMEDRHNLPDNVKIYDSVTNDMAVETMLDADVLVNIGNTVTNQLPSKLFEYISLGKPILNIFKIPDCPTLPYTAKYPLALDVFETELPIRADVDRVKDFILSKRGKTLPFSQVEAIYYDCTPEYVGERVYRVLLDTIDDGAHSKE